ncbi:MAG TPA: hypothetical protein VE287_01430, partial [Actinopolymorphaceae bacterium]|nr:hypothetical protein [Actinopolymorphaceae bacterium]
MSAAALVAASLVGLAAPAMATTGAKTPSVVTGPHYQRAGHVDATPGAQTFSCQLTDPAGCYGPAQIRTAYGIDKLAATGAHHTI